MSGRELLTTARRIVVKVGSSSLTTREGGLDVDRLGALVAHLVGAEALVLLSDVDALYDGPPARPGVRRIPVVGGPEDLAGVRVGSTGAAGVGSGGMVTKVEAAGIATSAGVPTL